MQTFAVNIACTDIRSVGDAVNTVAKKALDTLCECAEDSRSTHVSG